MKKLTLFFIASCIGMSGLYAQERRDTLLADFESQSTFFTVAAANLTMSVVPNPDPDTENSSSYVLQITGNANHDNSWESLYTPNNITTLHLNINNTDGYRYLHFKTHKNFISGMLWSLSSQKPDGSLEAKLPNQIWNSKTNEWEYHVVDLLELTDTWNITPGTYYRVVFNMTKTMSPKAAFVGYIDDVYLSNTNEEIPSIPTGINNPDINSKAVVSRLNENTVQIRISPEAEENLNLEVYNVQGQLLHSLSNAQASGSFDVNLPAGNLYILRATDNRGVYSIKF